MRIQKNYIENLGFSMVLIETDETFGYRKYLSHVLIHQF